MNQAALQNASMDELKFLVIACGSIISILMAIVGFFIVRGINRSSKSLEKMAEDIGEIKLKVMHVDTKHNELEKRVFNLERDK